MQSITDHCWITPVLFGAAARRLPRSPHRPAVTRTAFEERESEPFFVLHYLHFHHCDGSRCHYFNNAGNPSAACERAAATRRFGKSARSCELHRYVHMLLHEEAEGDEYIYSFIYSLLWSVTVELKGSRSITFIDDRLISIICLLQWVPCCSARVAVCSACKVIDHPVRCLFLFDVGVQD